MCFFDALRVKIKEDAIVRNKAIYLAFGVLPDGTPDILSLWIEGTKGAKLWLKVFNDLNTRGVGDILIALTEASKAWPKCSTPSSGRPRCKNVHGAPDPQLPRLRELEGPERPGGGPWMRMSATAAYHSVSWTLKSFRSRNDRPGTKLRLT